MLMVYHIFPVIVWLADIVLSVIREVIQYSWTVCADMVPGWESATA